MPKHYAILQKWDGEDSETLCLQYPEEKKQECERMFKSLRATAAKKKQPVSYRIVELPGEMDYDGKSEVDRRKREGIKSIIITQGKIYDDVPVHLQIDKKG